MNTFSLPFWWYLPLSAAALLGLLLLWFALLRDRSRGRRRCPGCWYDLSGAPRTPPIRCPECGRTIEHERDLHRTHRRWWLAAIACVLVLPLPAYFVWRDGARAYYAIMPHWKRTETLRAGEVTASRFEARNPALREARVVITTPRETLLDITDADIEFGSDPNRFAGAPPAPIGRGEPCNGIPTLVAFSYSGGAHCCYVVYIIECAAPARLIATIDGRNGIGVGRIGSTAGQELEFNISDQSFDYWNTSHAGSPFPSVFYRVREHHLELDLVKMLHPAAEVLAGRPTPATNTLDPLLWGTMLDLIYSGNEAEAWAYFDAHWPTGYTGTPDKAAFKKEFLEMLERSPQYQDFRAARAASAEGSPPPPARVGQYKPQPGP